MQLRPYAVKVNNKSVLLTNAVEWREYDPEGYDRAWRIGIGQFREQAQKRGLSTYWLYRDLPQDSKTLARNLIRAIKQDRSLDSLDSWSQQASATYFIAVESGLLPDIKRAMGWNGDGLAAYKVWLAEQQAKESSPEVVSQVNARVGAIKVDLSPEMAQKLALRLLDASSNLSGAKGAFRAFLGNNCPPEPIEALDVISGNFRALALKIESSKSVDLDDLLKKIEDLVTHTATLQKDLMEQIDAAKKGKSFFGEALDIGKIIFVEKIIEGLTIATFTAFTGSAPLPNYSEDFGLYLRSLAIEEMVTPENKKNAPVTHGIEDSAPKAPVQENIPEVPLKNNGHDPKVVT